MIACVVPQAHGAAHGAVRRPGRRFVCEPAAFVRSEWTLLTLAQVLIDTQHLIIGVAGRPPIVKVRRLNSR